MTRIYLVRHAHADWQPSDARPLSAGGHANAARLADLLAGTPIAAVYSSPSRRALETIEPLAARLHLHPIVLEDLRERELEASSAVEFEKAVEMTWRDPDRPYGSGESNLAARARGVAVVRQVVERHRDEAAILSTHGSLLAIILNAFDSAFGYDFWRTLTFPDVYEVTFQNSEFVATRHVWNGPTA